MKIDDGQWNNKENGIHPEKEREKSAMKRRQSRHKKRDKYKKKKKTKIVRTTIRDEKIGHNLKNIEKEIIYNKEKWQKI